MRKITDRLVAGKAAPSDIETLNSIAYQIDGKTVCAFGEACSWPVEAMVDKFRDELVSETSEDNEGIAHTAESEAQRRFLQPQR
jgi:NADH-quinone oxidoreductase subunit F